MKQRNQYKNINAKLKKQDVQDQSINKFLLQWSKRM
jgi:hypothetical protein